MEVSKALEEVWRWKDAVYEDTKGMTPAEVIAYFGNAQARLEKKTGVKLDLPRGRRRKRVPMDDSGQQSDATP